MLDTMPDAAFLSSVEIAARAGVSQPSVTRLAVALGFAGYSEFRDAVRRMVISDRAGDARLQRAPDPITQAVYQEADNLKELEATVASPAFQHAALLLSDSRPLGVAGFRASAALAQYFSYFAARVVPGVRTITDSGTLDDELLQLQESGASALLVFLMPRYPRAAVSAVSRATKLNLSTVVIADSSLVPFSTEADATLVAPVGSSLVFDSHSAAVALSVALLHAITDRHPERTLKRLEEHEALVASWALPGS